MSTYSQPSKAVLRRSVELALGAVITVVDGLACDWPSPPARHVQRVDNELGAEVVGDRVADDLPVPGVDHHRQIDPALVAGVLGDVGHPQPVRVVWGELAGYQIVVGYRCRVAAGESPTAPAGDALEVLGSHQSFHSLAADSNVETQPELCVHSWRAVGATRATVDVPDRGPQLVVLAVPLARVDLGRSPLVEAAGGHPKSPARPGDVHRLILGLLRGDEREGHCRGGRTFSWAKKAAARESRSRSARNTRFSRRSRTSSSRFGLGETRPLTGLDLIGGEPVPQTRL
jgi:hypothetical protein